MFHMGEVSELGRKAMLTMFFLCCLKGDLSDPVPEIDKANVQARVTGRSSHFAV